jgi:ATP-binding cassette, subfamily B, multidrug efflux pump
LKELKYLNKYLYKYRFRLLLGVLFICISNVFQIMPASLVRHSLDLMSDTYQEYYILNGFESRSILAESFILSALIYGFIILLLVIMRGVFLFLTRQTIIKVSRHIEYDLKNELYAHYQSLPLSFYRRNNTGDLMARISEDVSRVRMYLGPAIMYSLNMISLFAICIPVMFSVNSRLTLFVLAPLPILSISIYFVNNLINKRSEAIQKSLSSLTTFVQEAFSGIRVIKSFVREKNSGDQFHKESNLYRHMTLRLARVNAFFFPTIMALIGLSTIFTIYFGGLEVANGSITVGNIGEFVMYVNYLVWPVTALGWVSSIIQRAAASQKRLNEFLEEKTDIVSGLQENIDLIGKIQFQKVGFTYSDSGIEALSDLNFEINPGETVAIVGPTGSGKSTIANLLLRLYDPVKGRVLIDGHNLKDLDITRYRNQVGYVPQDVFLFSESIANNISFGDLNPGMSHVESAAKDADLYDNVMGFSQGFETKIGERGITLSGGQKQRTSIARALIRKPKLLILDDSLSAVDTETENSILNSLKRYSNKITTIIISHRVSSVKLANRIMVLLNGEIIQEGSHEKLMEKDGPYKRLYLKQLSSEQFDKV